MRITMALFLVLSLAGCTRLMFPPAEQMAVPRLEHAVDLSDSALVKKKLLAQHSAWKGIRYQLGGLSQKGIDCSGFVYVTFRMKLGLDIPRTTELQAKVGVEVSRKQLRTGDLIFFKTGIFARHVGVYLGNSLFLHASTSRGVTISNLNNSYWESNYWFSKRI